MFDEMRESGADEIYVGLKPPSFLNQLSFDGRFQTVAEHPAHFESVDDLSEVVQLAKSEGITVNFMANATFIPKPLQSEYVKFVAQAVDVGVDRLTISSIQTLQLLRDSGVDVPFTSGSAMAPTNIGHVRLLKSLGVSTITVPHCIQVNEISQWKNEGIEMIITGNFGSGSLPGSCHLWESPNNIEIGDGTRSEYRYVANDGIMSQSSFLDAATDCSLCSLKELKEAGVVGLKFIGREAPNPVTLAMVVDLFRRWLDMEEEGQSVEGKIETMEREDLMWTMKWVPRFCEKKRCTYLTTEVTSSYV